LAVLAPCPRTCSFGWCLADGYRNGDRRCTIDPCGSGRTSTLAWLYLHCACAETAISDLLDKVLTSPLYSGSSIFYRPIRVIFQPPDFAYTFSISITITISISVQSQIPPYFYFRLIGPNDLEDVSPVMFPTCIISSKFEVHETIRYRLMNFRCYYVTSHLMT